MSLRVDQSFLLVVVPILAISGQAAGAAALFQGVGDFAGGPFGSAVSAVSGDGSTVVGAGTIATGVPAEPNANHAFRWRAGGGLQSLGPNVGGFSESQARDVSYDGTVIVGRAFSPGTPSGTQAFRWTPGGGQQSLGGMTFCCLPDDTAVAVPLSTAEAVTRDGTQIFGTVFNPIDASHYAFRWTEGGGTQGMSFIYFEVEAVSDDGRYVAGVFDDFWAARLDWLTDLVIPSTLIRQDHRASAITADGSLIAGMNFFEETGFVWEDGATTLVPFGGRAITPDGLRIAGCGIGLGAAVFDRTSGLERSVEQLLQDMGVDNAFAGWQSSGCAEDISDDGLVIVGNGINASGQREGWVAFLREPDDDGDGAPNAADNCPFAANADQRDVGGIGSGSPPDGIGDACQCGDVDGDGRVSIVDATVLQRSLLQPPTATMTEPERCDVGGSAGCSLSDAATVRRALLQPSTATIQQVCTPARP